MKKEQTTFIYRDKSKSEVFQLVEVVDLTTKRVIESKFEKIPPHTPKYPPPPELKPVNPL